MPYSFPFRLLYNDDLTHLHTCESPYHKAGEPFHEAMIVADVDEVADAGFEAHLLQPGQGFVPLWQSRLYPYGVHHAWFEERYGGVPTAFDDYLLAGGDLVASFTRRCRERGTAPFVSLRMNDYHAKEYAHFTRDEMQRFGVQFPAKFGLSRFYSEHPEYRLHPDPPEFDRNDPAACDRDFSLRFKLRHARVLNWAIPAVRQQKFDFFKELSEQYDVDGIELDFMRDPHLFRQDETTFELRQDIINGFIRSCRHVLDATAAPGRKRYLAIRLPQRLDRHAAMGIDLPSIVAAGIDMVTLSCSYFTTMENDMRTARDRVPGAPLYFEFTHVCHNLTRTGQVRRERRVLTHEQLRTLAHLAYREGATGGSAFNFMYYRPYREWSNLVSRDMDLKANAEPPFEVVRDMKDAAALGAADQHYFYAQQHELRVDNPLAMNIELAAPTAGWAETAVLRIQADEPFFGRVLGVEINGSPRLDPCSTAEPYPTPYAPGPGFGRAEELRAWSFAAGTLRNGENRLRICLKEGDPVTVVMLELAVPARR